MNVFRPWDIASNIVSKAKCFDPISAVAGLASIGGGIASNVLGANAAEDAANAQMQAYQKGINQLGSSFGYQQSQLDPYANYNLGNLARLQYAMYGQTPTAASMMISPESAAGKNYLASHTTAPGQQLYQNPLTGEVSTTAPDMSGAGYGVGAGSLNPSARFGYSDYLSSPEYQVYQQAQDAAQKNAVDTLQAQAGASGMYGSGNYANALAQNLGNLYAQYQPQALATAQQNWNQARQNELAMLNPNMAAGQSLANYGGQYGTNVANFLTDQGAAQAQGITGAAEQWGKLASGLGTGAGQFITQQWGKK